MRQYAVILIALVVLVGGYVARRQLAGPAPTREAVQAAETAAQAAAQALYDALASGERKAEALAPKIAEVQGRCATLEAMRTAKACVALRGQGEALGRAAQNATIGDATVSDVGTSVAALAAELRPGK
jgi:hypothetical protein